MVVVIFASFFTLLILAVPIAMAMGFSTILPALIDPSFSGNLEFVVRSMIKGVDSCDPAIYAVRCDHGDRRTFPEAVRCICGIYRQDKGRYAVRGGCDLSVLWSHLRIGTGNLRSCRNHVYSLSLQPGI